MVDVVSVQQASVSDLEIQPNARSEAYGSGQHTVSADGRYVVYLTNASNFDPSDTNNVSNIYVRDLQLGTTTLVDTGTAGIGNGGSGQAGISGDGRYVVFTSSANNLSAGDINGAGDVFVRDLVTGNVSRVSVGSGGTVSNGGSAFGSISGDGRYVVFESAASNLVAGDTNNANDIFLHDRATGTTTLVTTGANGGSSTAAISANGRYVAFVSTADNLVAGDSNGVGDIFVKDLETGIITRASVGLNGQGNAQSLFPSISDDGRFVSYSSNASNLVTGDTNGTRDIFLRDTVAGTTVLISTGVSGIGNAGGAVSSVSGDGRLVAFSSLSTNLVPGDTNNAFDVFLRDVTAGTTKRISTGVGGTQSNGASFYPSISSDGGTVVFTSGANSFGTGDTNNFNDIYAVHFGGSNTAPAITSNGGGASAAVSIAENTTAVTQVTASDPDAGQTLVYAIAGGADADGFAINAATGVLTFVSAPDFEAPRDGGANNVYEVLVGVSDGAGGFDLQALAVTVTDVAEGGGPITGGTGPDILNGTTGNDIINGLAGDDQLNGLDGDDELNGGTGFDTLDGGNGADRLYGGAGNDTLRGLAGDDRLYGEDQNDRLEGGEGNDILDAGTGNDNLFGGLGDDTLLGGAGIDYLAGEAGIDRIDGGAGNDRFFGGAAADTFVAGLASGADIVVDFKEEDFLDVSAYLTGGFANLVLVASGANVIVDLGGGNQVTLERTSIASLDAGDFIF